MSYDIQENMASRFEAIDMSVVLDEIAMSIDMLIDDMQLAMVITLAKNKMQELKNKSSKKINLN